MIQCGLCSSQSCRPLVSRLLRFTSELATFGASLQCLMIDKRFTSLIERVRMAPYTLITSIATSSANCIISDVSQRPNLSSILVCIRVY